MAADRNDRRPPALQEQQHHDHHEDHRLVNGLDQLVNRLRDEFGRIVADVVVEAFRKTGLQPGHRVRDAFGGGKRIRAGALGDEQRDRGLAQHEAVGGIVQRAQFDPRHIAQAHDAAVGTGLDHDVLELRRILQTAGESQVGLERAIGDRGAGDLPAGDLQVLRADCRDDVARRHAQVLDLVRVEPDPHRIIARAEDLDVADAVAAGAAGREPAAAHS